VVDVPGGAEDQPAHGLSRGSDGFANDALEKGKGG